MRVPGVQRADVPAAGKRPQPRALGQPAFADPETDLWYGGYAGRTMTPSFLACGLLSAAILGLLAAFWDAIPPDRSGLALLAALGGIAALGLFQIVRWLYRVIAFGARLTTRRLFYHRGLIYPNWKILPLGQVATVEVRANLVERLLGVGRVCLRLDHAAHAPIILEGISRPGRLAELIRRHAKPAIA